MPLSVHRWLSRWQATKQDEEKASHFIIKCHLGFPTTQRRLTIDHILGGQSLEWLLRKCKADAGSITATATCELERNMNNRLRVGHIDVDIRFEKEKAEIARIERALAQFEDFCTVSQSVQAGIPMTVNVIDGRGIRLER